MAHLVSPRYPLLYLLLFEKLGCVVYWCNEYSFSHIFLCVTGIMTNNFYTYDYDFAWDYDYDTVAMTWCNGCDVLFLNFLFMNMML